MNILFTRFPLESRFGGAEVQALSLMEGLVSNGHEVRFLGSCPTLLREITNDKIQKTKLDVGPPPVSKWHAFTFLWRQFWMKKKLANLPICQSANLPDTVIMLSLTEKILLAPLLIKQGVKVIWLEHDRVGTWLSKNPWLPKLRKLSSHVTTVVVSNLSKKLYLDLGFDPDHVIAIPNGIDVNRLTHCHPEPDEGPNGIDQSRLENRWGNRTPATDSVYHPEAVEGSSQEPIHIGCISRLTHDKGLDVLIDAVSQIPNAKLTIVGTGRDADVIKKQAEEASNVQIISHIDDLGEFYRSLDLFVLPSRQHDPFGLVAAEAMLCGIPVIVTDACGIADYLDNGTDAIIVPAGESESLKNAIESLDPAMGQKGKGVAEKLFTVEQMVKRYEEILSS